MACVSVPGVLAPSLASSRRVARRVSGARAARVTSTVRAPSAPLGARRASPLARPRAARRAPRVSAASEEDLEKTLGASIDETFGDKAQAAFAKRTEETIDWRSIGKYFAATATQAAVMIYLTNWLSVGIVRSDFTPAIQKTIVGFWFLFNALRSRVFSPLNASRPKTSDEKTAIAERKRPSWMPPPLAFPVIWSSIALLRAFSSVAVFTVTGTLNHPAIFAMLAHLSIGDTWNSINNVEKSLGVACVGVSVVASERVQRRVPVPARRPNRWLSDRPLRGVDKRRDRARVDDLEHQPEGGRDARAARADDETRVMMNEDISSVRLW
jgi:tryptophan-rich sensory protein